MSYNYKQILSLALCLVAGTYSLSAYDFATGGLYYNIIDAGSQTVSVASRNGAYNSYAGVVEIPETVTYGGTTYFVTAIEEYAFAYCSDLTSVSVPRGLSEVGRYAFEGCTGLTEVHISDLAAWCAIDFADYRANPLAAAHHLYLNGAEVTDLVIPDGVTKIGAYAFDNARSLTSVVIPSGVVEIGVSAFYGCSSLYEVLIPEGVTSIGEQTFYSCTQLMQVSIPNSVTRIGGQAFVNCYNLISVTLPNGVTEIGEAAFAFCGALTEVTVPNSVTVIGHRAFYECSGLAEVTMGKGVASVGLNAFYGCTGLTAVHVSDLAAWCAIDFADYLANPLSLAYHLYMNGTEVTDLVIPDGVTKIGAYAFDNARSLTSVTIPSSVAEVGESAFYGVYAMTAIHISDLEAWCRISFPTYTANPLSYGYHLYLDGSEVTELVIPDGLTEVGDYVFSNGRYLTSVSLPSSVTRIGAEAFFRCTSLPSITLPASVTEVGNEAFYQCTALTEVTLGSGVRIVGDMAFFGCSSLTQVHAHNVTPPVVQHTTFDGETYAAATLYVPIGSKSAYAAAFGWSNFSAIAEEDTSAALDGIMADGAKSDGAIYTASGTRVATTDIDVLPAGVYIVNGKKVMKR